MAKWGIVSICTECDHSVLIIRVTRARVVARAMTQRCNSDVQKYLGGIDDGPYEELVGHLEIKLKKAASADFKGVVCSEKSDPTNEIQLGGATVGVWCSTG